MQIKTLFSRLCFVTSALLIVTQPFLANHAFAERSSQINCSQIEDSLERLRCFDQLFPQETQPTVKQKPASASEETPPPAVITSTSVKPHQQPSDKRTEVEVPPADARPNTRAPSIFSLKEKVNVTSKIAAIKAEHAKKMVFRLENGQVWLQDSPRALPFKVGQTVTVKSGRVGGYIMHGDQGTSTRVRQIN